MVLYSDTERVYAVPSQGGDLRTLATAEELKALGLALTSGEGPSARFAISEDDRWGLIYSGQVLARKRLDGTGGLEPVPLTLGGLQQGWSLLAVSSSDGVQIALQVREGNAGSSLVVLDSLSGKELGRVPADKSERMMGWQPSRGFLVFAAVDGKGELRRVDPKGQRTILHTLEPPLANASGRFRNIRGSADGAYYTYRYSTTGISQLVLGKGL